MTLRLAALIEADASGANRAFATTRGEMEKTGAAARKLGAEAKSAAAEIDKATQASAGLATSQSAATKELEQEIATIRRAREALAGLAAERALAARQTLNSRLGVTDDFGTAGRAADIAAWAKSRDDLRAKFDPMFAVQRTYVANLREIREAERQGVLSADLAAAAINRQKVAYAAYVTATRSGKPGAPLTDRAANARRQNLMAQGFDVMTSLAGGMNPALIAAQQGPQIIQAYGGVKETLQGVRAVLTTTRLAIGGVTAVLVAGGMAWDDYLQSTKQVETALAGIGRGSGATRSQINELSNDASSFGLTSGKVRELEGMFLHAGNIGVEAFRPALSIVRDYAATIGTDVTAGAQKLTAILADPARGAQQLRSSNLIDAASARQVQRLAEQNRIYEAQVALIEAVRGRLVAADTATTAWQRGVKRLSDSLTQAWDDWGRAIDRAVSGPSADQRLKDIDAEISRRSSGRFRFNAAEQAEIAALKKEREDVVKSIAAENEKAAAGRRSAVASSAVDGARGVLGQSPVLELDRRREQLRSEIRSLEERQRTAGAYDADPTKDAELRRQETAALEAKRSALAGLIPESQRQAELDRIDLQLMTARDPISRAALERRRAEVASLGEESSAAEKAALARNAYNKSFGEAVASGSSRVLDLRAETADRASVNDGVSSGLRSLGDLDELIRQQIELRPLLIALDKAEGQAKAELAAIIANLRNAYAAEREERARSEALRAIGSGRDELERMRAELQRVTVGNLERERALALIEANQRIRATFGSETANNTEAQQMRANAIAAVDLRSELERTKAAYEDIKTVGGGAIDSITQQLVTQSGSWKDVIAGVLNDIRGQFATWAIANPLKNALFGGNLPTMQDAGGVIGRLMGNTTPTPTRAAAAIESSSGLLAGKAVDAAIVPSAATTAAIPKPGVPATPGQQAVMNAVAGARVEGAFSTIRTSGTANLAQANPEFKRRLMAFQTDVDRELGPGLSVFSGYRTPEHQARLYAASGGSGMVAQKWRSMHGPTQSDPFGQAADLNWNGRRLDRIDPGTRDRIHDIAKQNDLYFPMNDRRKHPYEPWHVEPTGGRRQGGVLGPPAAANANAPLPDKTAAMEADKSLVSLSTSAQRADQNVTGFGGNLDQTAKAVASSATGVGGSAQQLAQQTAAVPAQTQGFFQTLLGGLGKGMDGIGSGIGGFFSKLGGSATVAHTGAIIGVAGNDNRPFSGGIFANAPRAHGGALLAGERALIAKVGKGVFTPKQMDNADKLISTAMQPRTLRVVDDRSRTASALTPALPASARGSGAGGVGGVDRIQIINPPGVPLAARKEERRRSDGGRDLRVQLAEMIGDDMTTSGSPTSRALGSMGVSPRPLRRGS